jgi:hypothetical protein
MFFIILTISLIALGIFSWLATRYNWFHSAEQLQEPAEPEVCCGQHEVCLKDNLQVLDLKPTYYEDEELDAFKGRKPESYTEAEAAQFEEIYESLPEDDLAGWLKSLQIRGLCLPDFLYEQALTQIAERRASVQ